MIDTAANTSVAILLSHERSGSHFLGDFINSLENVHMIDEVCNPGAAVPGKHRVSFHGFRLEWERENPGLALQPVTENKEKLIGDYFNFLASIFKKSSFVVDIKYGHVHNFEAAWWPILRRPLLMSYCQKHGIGIIHLYRENIVEAAISSHIAFARQKWHSWQIEDEREHEKTYTLNVAQVIQDARLLEKQNQWFREYWIGGARLLRLTYEEIAEKLGTDRAYGEKIAAFVGGSVPETFTSSYQKVTRWPQAVVANFDELAEACKRHGLAGFL